MRAMKIRKSIIAGTWYPGNPRTLRGEIERYIDRAETPQLGGIVALVSPHAGYVYSGQVAAFGYKLLQGRGIEKVIVLGPSHRVAFRGAALYGEGGFETPLGIVETDTDLSARIAGKDPSIGTSSGCPCPGALDRNTAALSSGRPRGLQVRARAHG